MVDDPILILRQGAKKRDSERGAAIFVVVLVVTLLTGIGLFAARVTGSVDAAAGYARQAAQSKGLAIYAAQMSAAVLASQREAVQREMTAYEGNPNPSPCVTNRYRGNVQCALRRHQDLDRVSGNSLGSANTTILNSQSDQAHGSLGPRTYIPTVAGVEGNLLVEYFERVPVPYVSGSNQGTNRVPGQVNAFEYSVTASAQIRPVIGGADVNWCSPDNESSSANVQAIRAYVIVPE